LLSVLTTNQWGLLAEAAITYECVSEPSVCLDRSTMSDTT